VIGPTLRTLRQQRGLSQRAVAERAGIQQHQLSTVENDKTRPDLSTIVRIADALDCDAAITITPRDHAT
jgi:transcriptional regulator with XRE-family HTH domain